MYLPTKPSETLADQKCYICANVLLASLTRLHPSSHLSSASPVPAIFMSRVDDLRFVITASGPTTLWPREAASRSGLNQIGILRFENSKSFLGFPVEPRVGSKEKIHFFQSALIRFGVKGPHYGNREGIARTKDIKGLLSDVLEHDGAKKNLRDCVSVLSLLSILSTSQVLTVHPFPMLHPTTPHALPLARTCKGKISAGYSHGTVSQVAPNPAVKTKVKVAAAAPYCAPWSG